MLTFAAEPSPKKRSPKKKAKPGRPPKRASQLSQQETDVEAEQSQSPPVDLDASMQGMEIEDSSANVLTSSTKEETIDEGFDTTEELHKESDKILLTTEEVATPDADIDRAATNDELFNIAQTADESMDQFADISGATEAQATSPDIERVEETIINEPTFKDESSPAPETPESENDTTEEVIPATTSDAIETSFEAPVEEQTSPAASEEVEPEISAFQSMRGKLESLIGDLKTVALTREEVHKLEDLFFDAKKHLYSAEQRGRSEKSRMNM
jgi:hypothetical protein